VPKVFINYRAQEQAGYGALLDRELAERFGPDAVFRASRSIRPGDDFAKEIVRNLRLCTVLLAVIGPGWLAHGNARGTDDDDWVRREIAEAFSAGVRVIPILVEDATMPTEAELPPDIAALARCQYLRMHHRSVDSDINRVVAELDHLFPGLWGDRRTREIAETEVRQYRLTGSPATPCRIGVVTGSIRRVRFVDVWVNSENTDMEMARFAEFSMSGIIRYWGAKHDRTGRVTADLIADELAVRVGDHRPVAPGTAFVTGAGALTESHRVRYIIHVAAVQGEPGAGFRQVREIGRCVTTALAEADRLAEIDDQVRTILFPLLGVGVGGAELKPTAQALLRAAVDHLVAEPKTALRVIYFLAYSDAELAALTEVLNATPRLIPITPPPRR
jgi:O-acetyl-ADP-ribose deacetylase (regulator of RNase III)